MIRRIALILMIALGASIAQGCGTQEPYASDTDTDTGTDTALPTENDYYPLTVGSTWEYKETTLAGAISSFSYTVKEKTTIEFEHGVGEKEVFVIENDLSSATEEGRVQYYEDEGARVTRLRHLVADNTGNFTKQRDYVPGFLRFDRSKTAAGYPWIESLTAWTDRMDGTALSAESVQYQYEVIEEHQEVTVPAGTFDCLVVERTALSGGKNEVKQYFFAKGVGKVKEITEGEKVEDLASYTIAP
ncbi:MAG: hypothetical protein MUC50_20685 [Myxococcota bacterium]|jgi:hypothetical protein|nr:hypothetical protein [Myxococcota bacterium]